MDESYTKLIEKLSSYHFEVLKKDVLDNPVMLGDYLVKIRAYANFILPYVNRAIDKVNTLQMLAETERLKIYKADIKAGMSTNASMNDARELTRLMDAQYEVARREVDKLANDYKRFDTLTMTMQSRLREFGVERMMEGR